MTDMRQKQMDLEAEQLELGQARYFDMLKAKGVAEMGPGRRLVAGNIDKMIAAIKGTTAIKRGRRAAYLNALQEVEPVSAAMLALRTVLQQVGKAKSATAVATTIGMMMVEHLNWKRLHHHTEKDVSKGARFMEHKVLKHKGHEKHRRMVANHYVDRHLPPYSMVEWSNKTMVSVGMILLELMAENTGLIKLPVVFKHGRSTKVVELTETTVDWLNQQNERFSLLDPLFMPMVVPPRPWTTPTNGGYLGRRQFLMKQPDAEFQRQLREAQPELVYGAVNLLQETAYKINTGVLSVMAEALAGNMVIAGLVSQDLEPMNAKPVDIKTNEEARKAWKVLERERHDRNAAKRNQRLVNMRIVNLATKFAEFPAIYFPHFLDFRGRAYPMPVDLQPQGSDQAKGLLTFAEGRPLGTTGLFWLKVHIANLFGIDKVSFEERVQWVNENEDTLIACAMEPLDYPPMGLWWTEADKPWQALAACFELAGVALAADPEEYVSHLPIAMDGSCNGLQNLSAMMLDEEGGKATNLVPADKPQDIYTQVLERTLDKLQALVTQDGDETSDKAKRLLTLGLNRKIVKRPVMTRPYGSTGFGVRDMLVSELRKQGLYDKLPGDHTEQFAHVMLLAGLVEESINEVVVASKQVMDWLQSCARVAADYGRPLRWVTPVGLPVLQDYRVMMADNSRVYIGGQEKKFTLLEHTDEVNKRRQASGMSPNVIHSFDASHMMLTVIRANEEFDITDFAMVHDSYATHACQVGELAACLRAVFIEMYEVDQLADMHAQFSNQLPPEVAAELPAPPARGTLDLSQVEQSYYFFA